MITIPTEIQATFQKEPTFRLFQSSGLWCCVVRTAYYGNLNGYCAVPKGHKLYGKVYSDKIVMDEQPIFNGNYIGLLCANPDEADAGVYSLDLAIKIHGGLTYSDNSLYGIHENCLGELWWFGFDTVHAGDAKPYMTEIDLKYLSHLDEEYRSFEYVNAEVISLAKQLSEI